MIARMKLAVRNISPGKPLGKYMPNGFGLLETLDALLEAAFAVLESQHPSAVQKLVNLRPVLHKTFLELLFEWLKL